MLILRTIKEENNIIVGTVPKSILKMMMMMSKFTF
jgi:hypothetical protein